MTRPSMQGRSGHIEVTVANTVHTKSGAEFTYVDPVLADFSPQRGPMSGGSLVVISGDHLDLGSKIAVSILGKDCPVVRSVSEQGLVGLWERGGVG